MNHLAVLSNLLSAYTLLYNKLYKFFAKTPFKLYLYSHLFPLWKAVLLTSGEHPPNLYINTYEINICKSKGVESLTQTLIIRYVKL